jgi:hypothetical protein
MPVLSVVEAWLIDKGKSNEKNLKIRLVAQVNG